MSAILSREQRVKQAMTQCCWSGEDDGFLSGWSHRGRNTPCYYSAVPLLKGQVRATIDGLVQERRNSSKYVSSGVTSFLHQPIDNGCLL